MARRSGGSRRTPAMIEESFIAGLRTSTQKYEAKKELMTRRTDRVKDVYAELEEKAVYQILDNHGIFGNDRIKYLNFARRIYHLAKRFSRQALINAAAAEIARWSSMGCDVTILREIATAFGAYGTPGGAGRPVAIP
ncbi:MAG: hypothetical protein DRJ18_02220 [Candidatus Methanomethylicota archaeon]|nr:MAG: hypothetical protein DRJ18_02220 [Candidatus Verstraetearchaeota archaeon]